MAKTPYLLLDAGGTIVFIEQDYLSALAADQDFSVTGEQIHDQHFRIMHWFDSYVREERRLPPRVDRPYPQILLEALGMHPQAAAHAGSIAEQRERERSLWTHTFPWVRETLQDLKAAGYRMSIISNADGTVPLRLAEMGLSVYFDRIYDSSIVGISKPNPAIFTQSLQELDVPPDEALYVGDMFYVDVWGANRAGIGAVHLDPLGLYERWPGVHIRSLQQLPGWLEVYGSRKSTLDLLPLRNFVMATDGR